jgi:hypothetical protein
MEKGDAPDVVAKAILAAATDPTPKRRYAAGKMARQVSFLRRFRPRIRIRREPAKAARAAGLTSTTSCPTR